MQLRISPRHLIILTLLFASTASAQEPWTTYRGNSQRTGNTDNKPGPAKPTSCGS